jgi:type IV secretory pathway TraG/TraD family ATPase VirD4
LRRTLAYAAHSDVPTLATVYNLLETRDLLARLARSAARAVQRAALYLSDIQREHYASCRNGVASKLAWLDQPAVRRFTSSATEPVDFARLRERPTAVYLCLNEQDMTVMPGMISLFWTILLHQMINSAGSVPVTLLLDEFANTGKIPNFARLHAVARGRDIAIWLGLQSLSRLDSLYRQETARTIRDNSTTKLVLAGLDHMSAEEISRALGEGTVQTTRKTRTPEGWLNTRVSYSDHEVSRRVMTADEVRRLPGDELLMISANRRPLRLDRMPYEWPTCAAATTALGAERALDTFLPTREIGPPPTPLTLPDLPRPPMRPAHQRRRALRQGEEQGNR